MNIFVIYGSLREKSLNKALAQSLHMYAPQGMSFELQDCDLPLYNGDIEDSAFPAEVTAIKNKIRAADGIIMVTPEYNRSIPGVLKNLIDWTGRPSGDGAWGGKPVGVLGVSSGNIGTALAQNEVKKVLNYYNTHVLGQPEFYMNGTEKFDADLQLTDEKTKDVLTRYLNAFNAHVARFI